MEEEVYSDSDDSSVYTSEDDFDEDKLTLTDKYIDLAAKHDVVLAE